MIRARSANCPFHVIINPSYEPVGDQTRSFYEGCLSFAGYQAVRRRWLDIIARWQDEDGNRHEERLHGWPARIFQHETITCPARCTSTAPRSAR